VPPEKILSHPICGKCKTPLRVPTSPVNVTTEAFNRVISSWPEYVLVEFWSRTCGYCRAVEPVVNSLASSRPGLLMVAKVDVDAEPALATRFEVKATPIFVLFKNRTQIARMDGAPKETFQLHGWVKQFVR